MKHYLSFRKYHATNPTKNIILSIIIALSVFILTNAIQQSFTSFWINSIVSILIIFISIYLLTNYLNKQTEKYLIHTIHQKIKHWLPLSETTPETISTIDELNKLIEKIQQHRIKEQEHFKHLDSYRKEYLGNISHELKTPLFNLQGYISTLLDGAIDDQKIQTEYLKKSDKNIERMIQIIDDLETISQLESGAMILDYEFFDIEPLIYEVFEQMELVAKQKNINLELLKEDPGYYLVNADKFRIRQVLINLISNAIKYNNLSGFCRVILNKDKNKIRVTVQDNGIGIDEKHLPRIFERFYRVDKGRSREQGGTGLGLAIVKHIIEAHKQTIYVKSETGKGTSFTFTLNAD